jgi:hypothetical protein
MWLATFAVYGGIGSAGLRKHFEKYRERINAG